MCEVNRKMTTLEKVTIAAAWVIISTFSGAGLLFVYNVWG